MARFAVGRVAEGLAMILLVSVLAFAFCEAAPGDFLTGAVLRPEIPEETLQQWRLRYGLDRSATERYFRWVGNWLRGDLGVSFSYQIPVTDVIRERIWQTLLLNVVGLAGASLLAVPLGAWSAARRRKWAGRWLDRVMGLTAGLPDLLVAIGALLLAVSTGWFPTSGSLPLCGMVLVTILTPALFRQARAAFIHAGEQSWVLAARSRGIREQDIQLRYIMPEAINPLASVLGLSLSMLLSASLMVEVVLSWPGLGPLLVESVLARDTPVILASVMISGVFLLVGNSLGDLLRFAADPRLRGRDAPP